MTAIKQAIGVLDIFRVRGDVFMNALLKVLRWAQAAKGLKLDAAQIRTSLAFVEIGRLAEDRQLVTTQGSTTVDLADIPDAVLAPLRAYLREIPGFDPAAPLDMQASGEAGRHHDQVLLSLRPDLESYVE
jgi:intracellular multiplication protein IcmO